MFRPHVLWTGSSKSPCGGRACIVFSEPASSVMKQLYPRETPSSRGTVKHQKYPYLVNQINGRGSYDYSITHPFFSKYPAEKLSSQLREESLKKPFLSYTLSELRCFLRSWGKADIECLELGLHYGNLLVSSSSHPQTSSS